MWWWQFCKDQIGVSAKNIKDCNTEHTFTHVINTPSSNESPLSPIDCLLRALLVFYALAYSSLLTGPKVDTWSNLGKSHWQKKLESTNWDSDIFCWPQHELWTVICKLRSCETVIFGMRSRESQCLGENGTDRWMQAEMERDAAWLSAGFLVPGPSWGLPTCPWFKDASCILTEHIPLAFLLLPS